MHYIQRSSAPQKLREHFGEWTKLWHQFYTLSPKERKLKKSLKPKKNQEYWRTFPEIRNVLIQDFQGTCGYCGIGINERKNAQGVMIPCGQTERVD